MPVYSKIQCSRCGKTYDSHRVPANDACGGRIEFYLDIEALKERVTRKSLDSQKVGLRRYIEFLPLEDATTITTLGEGGTPLLQSNRLAETLGLQSLYLKNETVNPTGSFKDRPISVGVNRAFADGSHTVVSASSGNAASAMAAYAARMGLRAVVLVPEDIPRGKLTHIQALGALVFRVRAIETGIDPTTQLLWKLNELEGWTPVPSFGPFNGFQFEGTKTLGYEIVEQLEWDVPDWILFPTGSGGLMAGTMKGLLELYEIGLIDRLPRPVIVQPKGCAPIVRAYTQSSDKIKPWGEPHTSCGGLADPIPWDGDAALKYLYQANGTAIAVSDEDTTKWLLRLAKTEGIFAEPSGAAGLAGLEILVKQGVIDRQDTVVVPITGSGFKDLEFARSQLPETPVINPTIDDLKLDLTTGGNSTD
ncbi:MAG: threonine synthase [Candidatus Thorarchaeota archaeon]|nr:threonine synthase [Candidatus Thorarchaeota archaeon]